MNTIASLLAAMLAAAPAGAAQDAAPAKAVEYSAEQGLRLSPVAEKTIGLRTAPSSPGETQAVPLAAVVYFQDRVGLYRLREGRYKLVEARVLSKDAASARVQCRELKRGDRVVVAGAALLRVAELQAVEPGE